MLVISWTDNLVEKRKGEAESVHCLLLPNVVVLPPSVLSILSLSLFLSLSLSASLSASLSPPSLSPHSSLPLPLSSLSLPSLSLPLPLEPPLYTHSLPLY